MMNRKLVYGIAVGIAATTLSTFAQTNEVADLRNELASVSARLAELEKSTTAAPVEKKESWADKIKFKGDLRYRFEYIGVDGDTAQNRQRIRVRLGAYADVNDFTTAGIQIRTGGGANSGNQTIGGEWDNKDVYFDLAYITLAPEDAKYGELTLGKMKYPWKTTTDLIWDSDVNPEGVAYVYNTKMEDTALFANAGGFKVVETGSAHDANLVSGQAGLTQPLGDNTKATVGGSIFNYQNAQDFGAPVDYNIVEGFAEVAFKEVLPVGFKLYGDYVNNTQESSDNQGYCFGVKFGDAKKGKWEAKVDFRELEENAAPAPFADSDFAGGGTDVRGGRVKGAYNICKHLQAGITFIAGEIMSTSTDVDTLHLDLIAKF